jgi:hypothetical protein
MSLLLDTDDPARLDPRDLLLSLAAMERLGAPAQAVMFQPFIEFAARQPARTVPTLIHQVAEAPLAWSGRLSAAALGEILASGFAGSLLDMRAVAVPALANAVGLAAVGEADLGREAIAALAAWSGHEPVPEAAGAVRAWLQAATQAAEPRLYVIRQAQTILDRADQ